MSVAVSLTREAHMFEALNRSTSTLTNAPVTRRLSRILSGFRFTVCTGDAERARALDVRRRVYVDGCGYEIPVPDAYDGRSWLLLAEDTRTGEAIGTMRITPRSAGPLEAEEYFTLPPCVRNAGTIEVNRFAILPAYRSHSRVLPVVWAGLVKTAIAFISQIGAESVVVCSTPERAWNYVWLNLNGTGAKARYAKLGGVEHELLYCHVREAMSTGHRFKEWFLDASEPEIELPARVPAPGDETIVPSEPLRAVGGARR
jgi:hypothetical protein